MPAPLSSGTVRRRLLDFPRDNYLYIGSFMRSVVLAAATLVLLDILDQPGERWPRLTLWFASLLAGLVTYTTWGRTVLLMNSRGNLWDAVFPLLMGINEFCLFGILASRMTNDPLIWRWWLIIVGSHALFSSGLAHNRIHNTRLENDFASELRQLAVEYDLWIKKNRKEAAVSARLAFVLGSFTLTVLPRWLQGT